jgi:hypothetical protein
VDELAKLGFTQAIVPTWVFLHELLEPSILKAKSSQETPPPSENITESPEVMEIHSNWRTPFMIYLRIGGLPNDKVEHECLCHRAGQYTLVNDELFGEALTTL